jgi:xylan 1,4-beta-xylosidase
MSQITNPILPGFHPDPSICIVGDDYYIATSTFEWWPAVRIHHSKNLVNWTHCTYAVTRTSQLDLAGHPDSTGVWAPCLSYAHGQFWLIYSDVRSMYGAYKDVRNFLITAPSITGPWSEPIYMNSSGFDPSLFHDDDGRTWFLNQEWMHHPGSNQFNGILLQEYDKQKQKLVGPIENIFMGSDLGVVEGSHLYKRLGYYYLMTAEGGTFYEHAVTMARSKSIHGPYEIMPGNPVLTSYKKSAKNLQRAGHASLVETQDGEWYLAHLCGRPLEWTGPHAEQADHTKGYENLHCNLGRETALQKMQWRADGWLELEGGGNTPKHQVQAPRHYLEEEKSVVQVRDDFDSSVLGADFNSLRQPMDNSWMSLTARPGYLRLAGRESLMSVFDQSLVARRQQHFNCRVETLLDFRPENFQQMAGLVAYYNTATHSYFHVSADPVKKSRVLRLYLNQHGALTEVVQSSNLPDGPIRLRMVFNHDAYQHYYSAGQGDWIAFGPAMSTSVLSDEFMTRSRDGYPYSFGFTGNFVGMACQDLTGAGLPAYFDYFDYEALA